MRKAGRKDATQAAIVGALRAIGCEVRISNQEGWPDLYVHHGRFRFGDYALWLPVEAKSPGGRLTGMQELFMRRTKFPVVSSVDEALALFGIKP